MTGLRRGLALAAVVLAVGCGRGQGRRRAGAVEAPRRGVVHRGPLAPRLVLTGELRAAASVDLDTPQTDTWQLAIRWLAEDGAEVAAGARVVEFDNTAVASALETKKLALRQAEQAVRSNRDVGALQVADKEATVRAAAATLAKAQILADVPADLLPGRTAQERQLELRRAEVALASAETDLAAQRKSFALDQQIKAIELIKAQRTIDDAVATMRELVLTAPRAGVVQIADHPWEGRKLHVGDSTQPGWTVASMPELASGLEVRAELSDVDDGKVAVGMVGACTLDAVPATALPCTVSSITPVARNRARASLRKSFDLVLTIATGAGPEARPGMSVKVVLARTPVADALLVPRGAVVVTDAGAQLRLPGGGRRAITLGACDAQACVVETGATAGTAVEIGRGS